MDLLKLAALAGELQTKRPISSPWPSHRYMMGQRATLTMLARKSQNGLAPNQSPPSAMPTSWPAVYPTSACDPLPSEALVADRTPERPARRLLDRVRDAIRTKHYSRATETAYLGWIRRVILFHGKRQPAKMGEAKIAAYLTHLVTARRVSAQRAVREAALKVQIIKLERPNLRRNMAYG